MTRTDLRRADALTDRHFGKTVRFGQVEGVLTDILPLPAGKGIVLGLVIGGARAFTDALAPDAVVEVVRREGT